MRSWFAEALADIMAAAFVCCIVIIGAVLPASGNEGTTVRPVVSNDPTVAPDSKTGAALTGIVLNVTPRRPDVPLGSSVTLDIAMTNVTTTILSIGVSSPETDFQLEIRDPSGYVRKIERENEVIFGIRTGIINPGASLVRTYTIDKGFINAPGKYRIVVKSRLDRLDRKAVVIVPSKPVTVTITEQSKKRPDVCGDISHSYKTLDPYNGARKSGLTLKLGVKQSSVPKDSPIVLEI
ncbi:MAG: hypothetical protein Q7T82_15065, partial [Armatimonadota bacterium]|nr:hypothetical protein [Armatimonadota bacterium]